MSQLGTAALVLPKHAAIEPAQLARFQEQAKNKILLKLLQAQSDTIEHLFCATGWDHDVTQRVLLQLVAEGKVKCTLRADRCWYSVRDARTSHA